MKIDTLYAHPVKVSKPIQYVFGLADWRSICAFSFPLIIYLLTLTPTIYNLDSAELTVAAATAGLTRSTGYPLYLMLGHLWSYIPIGDVGYRLNLFSAFHGALTIMLSERILRHLGVESWPTFGALGLLACGIYFWSLSLIAEVYTLHTALMALMMLLILRWSAYPSTQRLVLVGLVTGLSMGHHAATVLLLPGAIFYVLATAPRMALRWRTMVYVVSAFAIGLSVYLYLPLRYAANPSFNYAGFYDSSGVFEPINLHTIQGLWWLISGQAFVSHMLVYGQLDLWRELTQFGTYVWQSCFAVGVGPALVGLVVLARHNWRLCTMFGLMFIVHAAFYLGYRVIDKETMFLPTFLIWAIWLGVGYQWLLSWVQDDRQSQSIPLDVWVLRVGMVAAVVVAIVWNWPLVDRSDDWSVRERSERMLEQVQPDALILGWWGVVPPIEYLQIVEGYRPDVQTINRFLIGYDDMNRLIATEASRRPVYIDTRIVDLPSHLEVRKQGSLYRVQPKSKFVSSRVRPE